MKRAWIAVLCAVAAVLPTGCGTICNFAHGDPDVYGGVQKDVEFIQTPRTPGGGGVSIDNRGMAVLAALAFADTGLSLIADTLTLPLAIYMRHEDHASDDAVSPGRSDPVNSADPATQAVSPGKHRADNP
jgi:uncharacterized protein YceK